ncbi:hypothetical protein [Sorangium sp. So ce388]|uniref:hypothetical protein n=1 Tax=Sorangium sp. So ce388 TaxID=3133309 RepID=UPI003F5C49C1
MTQPAVLGSEPIHYRRLNLDPGRIQPWEDGLRTDPGARSFEWWYHDCRLDDGTRVTIELHTKPPVVSPSAPLTPFVSLVMLRPDGSLLVKNAVVSPDAFSASRDGCDVRIGEHWCRGDLRRQEVHVELEGTVIDLEMISELAPWRPATGHMLLGEDESRYIAWLPVMPRARVTAEITAGGRRERLGGVGYHDHNWGNVAPASAIDHWYWGHAHIGEYTVVTLRAVSHAKYGKAVLVAYLLARGGEVLAQGTEGLELSAIGEARDPGTGVPVASRLIYEIPAGDARYRLEFARRRDVLALGFGDAGGYLRFVGDARLERVGGAGAPEGASGDGLWEVLSFGPRQAAGAPAAQSPG